jgi:hypothetical protein
MPRRAEVRARTGVEGDILLSITNFTVGMGVEGRVYNRGEEVYRFETCNSSRAGSRIWNLKSIRSSQLKAKQATSFSYFLVPQSLPTIARDEYWI